jgi:hypothetical protein
VDNKWIVTWSSSGTPQQKESAEFDHLILCCGFATKPRIPCIPGLESFPGEVIHSTSYSSPDPFKGKHVAVIGGSFSSVEIVDDLALHAASVHHVIPRPFWAVSRYLPLDSENPGSPFLPLDVVFGRRFPISENPSPPQKRWKRRNEYFRSLYGDQSCIFGGTTVDDMPPYVTVSDLYAHFVRSGRVTPYIGHLARVSGLDLTLTSEGASPLPSNITHIILATGFETLSEPNILPPSLLSDLNFSNTERFLPILLHRHTLHPALPNAAVVGHIRGLYWAIVELQARWCAGLFTGKLKWPSPAEMQDGIALVEAVRNFKPRTQLPISDIVRLVSDLADTVGTALPALSPVMDKRLLRPQDVIVPAHLTPPVWLQSPTCRDVADLALNNLEQMLSRSATEALFVAAAVFRSLFGSWVLTRSYVSRRPEYPSGHSIGTAEFTLRNILPVYSPSRDGELRAKNVPRQMEYLYSEKTELTTSTGATISGTQRYIYRYDEPDDKLEVLFTRRDEEGSPDRLFHRVDFVHVDASRDADNGKQPWRAKASHFCSPDAYEVAYTFYFKGADLDKWKIVYEVMGPKKDYTMETWYTRQHGVSIPDAVSLEDVAPRL